MTRPGYFEKNLERHICLNSGNQNVWNGIIETFIRVWSEPLLSFWHSLYEGEILIAITFHPPPLMAGFNFQLPNHAVQIPYCSDLAM